MNHRFYAHKYRIYTFIAAALLLGAILYSGSAAVGSHEPSDVNPVQSGAAAASPSGVPSCLTACGTTNESSDQQYKSKEMGEAGESPSPAYTPMPSRHPAAAPSATQSGNGQTGVASAKATGHSQASATVNNNASNVQGGSAQTGVASAQASGHAKATATVTNNITNKTTVNKTVVEQQKQVVYQQPVNQPQTEAPTPYPTTNAETNVAATNQTPCPPTPYATPAVQTSVTQPVVVQPVAATTPAPLPATGNQGVVSGALGSASIVCAGLMYRRSRRKLLRASLSKRLD